MALSLSQHPTLALFPTLTQTSTQHQTIKPSPFSPPHPSLPINHSLPSKPPTPVDSALATLRQWQSQDLAASPREQQQPAHKPHPTRPILTLAPAPVPGASQRGHRGEGRWGRGEGGPWGGPASAASQNHAAAGSIHPTSSCQWCLPESEGPSFPVLPAWAPSAKQLGLRRFSSTGPNQLYAHSQSSTAAVAAAAADSAIALPRVRAAAAHGAGAAAAQHGPPCGEHVWGSFRGGAAGAMGGGVSYSGGGAAAPRPSRLSDSCVPPLGGFNHGHCGGPGGPCAGGPLPGQHVKAQRLTADSVYPQQTPRMAAATFSKGSYQGGSFPAASPINQSGGRYPAAPMQLPPMDGAGSCPAASQQDAISALLKSPAANHAPNGGSHLDNSKARSSGSSSFKQAAGSPRSHIPKQGDAGHLQAHNPRQVGGGGSEDHQEDWLKLCMKEVKKINKKRVSQEQAAV